MTCLVPLTRVDTFDSSSILADGWNLVTEIDSERKGANATRQILFKKAFDSGVEFIRLADDDDVILPHREIALNELSNPNIDVVYFDFLYDHEGEVHKGNFSGNLLCDAYSSPAPWTFVIKTKALNGRCPFDPKIPAMEGGYAFLEMLKMGLRFKHVKVPAYHWNMRSTDGVHLHSSSNDLLTNLRSNLMDWIKSK